jgi:hypothetical protein
MWQAPPVPAGAAVSGWGTPPVSEPSAAGDSQDGAAAPSAWGTSAPSVFAPPAADAPAASPEAGAEPGSPNWFNPAGRPASAGEAAPASGNGWSWPNGDSAVPADKEEPGDGAAPVADEDWPTRYSWLDEEPEEPEADAVGGDAKPAGPVAATVSEPALAGDATVLADVVAPAQATVATEVIETAESAAAAEVPGVRENDPAGTELLATEPAATEPGDQSPAAGLVTVIRGVPRFHQEDCVLIRFMPEGDAQKMPAAAAREAGCTPCAACQPEG